MEIDSSYIFKRFHNRIFIHIPKCAGISIWRTLSPKKMFKNEQHTPVYDYVEAYGIDYLKENRAYTIVRNPYDRIVSWYFYHIKLVPEFFVEKNIISFKDWIKNKKMITHWDSKKFFNKNNVLKQTTFLKYENKIVLDPENIYKLEEISKLLPDQLNKSSRTKDYMSYYDEETLHIVTNHCEEDFQAFGYEKVLKLNVDKGAETR